jgi:hypothetical protein
MQEAAEFFRTAALAGAALVALCHVPVLIQWHRGWKRFLKRW